MEEKRELGLDEMKKVSGGAWSEDGEEYSRVYMYPCPFCDEEFADHNEMLAHIRSTHQDMID